MSWINVDWLQHETEVFLDEIRIINEVYDRMFGEFDAAYKKHEEEARDTADAGHMIDMLNWYVDVRQTEQQMLTAMTLAVTSRSIEDLLRRFLTYFFKNDALPPGNEVGKMLARFDEIGVRLSDQQEFQIIHEMRLARNSCIHDNNVPSKKYLVKFPNPRWHDNSDKISLCPDEWKQVMETLAKWADELRGRLHSCRQSKKAPAAPPTG